MEKTSQDSRTKIETMAPPVSPDGDTGVDESGQIDFALDDHSFTESETIEIHPDLHAHVAAGETLVKTLDEIPHIMAFKIGEAAEMVGVKQYVLRYWESEFDALRPRKSKNNQRVYSRRDVETAMMIKKLLYEDRFSIEGARAALRQLKTQVKEEKSVKVMTEKQDVAVTKLRTLVTEIRRIRDLLA